MSVLIITTTKLRSMKIVSLCLYLALFRFIIYLFNTHIVLCVLSLRIPLFSLLLFFFCLIDLLLPFVLQSDVTFSVKGAISCDFVCDR